MKKNNHHVTLLVMLLLSASLGAQTSEELRIAVNDTGYISHIEAGPEKTDILASVQKIPLLRIRKEKEWLLPVTMNLKDQTFRITYPDTITAHVTVAEYPSHVTFELISVNPEDAITAVIWGPFHITLGETVGEIVGVVRGQGLAFGLQALNVKTTGGKLEFEDGSIEDRGTAAFHVVVNGSSRSSHFYWHINHYLNWGEPWYEGFRESMQEYRIKNQALLARNYLSNMLGWYLLTATTTLADIEWMLARAAGYNAGFALASRMEAFRFNPDIGSILNAIREWETARHCGVFSPSQRERLKDPHNEFHLKSSAQGWILYPYQEYGPFIHKTQVQVSGKPVLSEWTWLQKEKKQPLQFVIRTSGNAGSVDNPVIVLDHEHRLHFPVQLEAGMTLSCDGVQTVRIYDVKGRFKESFELTTDLPELNPGQHTISFNCHCSGSSQIKVAVSIKVRSKGEAVVHH